MAHMDLEFKNTFAGKRVLITGHTGFKGSWLAIWLNKLGADVYGASLPNKSKRDNFLVANVGGLITQHIEQDINELAGLKAYFDQVQPDFVFHLAAQALVRSSYDTPIDTFQTNVMGTAHVLDCARVRNKPCTIVIVSSDKCYENTGQVWGYRECDAMGGSDPYSASKGCTELVCNSYRDSFFNPKTFSEHGIAVGSGRAGNVIGGGDWAEDRLIPDIIRAFETGRSVEIRNPKAIRPWQHVLEPLSGYLTLAAKLSSDDPTPYCTGYNFGPSSEAIQSVGYVTDVVSKYLGRGTTKDVSQGNHVHEAQVLRLSIEKAVSDLKWKPVWTIQETLEKTVSWYRSYLDNSKVSTLQACLDDIKDYENDATKRI